MIYGVLSQTAAEVADLGNAPAVAIGPYLLKTEQTRLLHVISIYVKRGDSREQLRLLYMNAPALALWREMGKTANVIEQTSRPPKTATLAFGVPFSP
ncbi:MAG: hypothetical protein WAM39_14275 [Bryobacteraceae bacterium]